MLYSNNELTKVWASKGTRSSAALASTHEAHRKAQFAHDGNYDAAARSTVEFGQHNSGNTGSSGELTRLREAVLARGGIEHEQNVMRRAGHELGGGALHLFEFLHQVGFRVQAPRGIHDDHVHVARASGGQAIIDDGGGIGAGFLFDQFRSGAIGPDGELLDCGGAKGISGAKHHGRAILTQPMRQLADRRGFAGAVYADYENYPRTGIGGSAIRFRGNRIQDTQQLIFQARRAIGLTRGAARRLRLGEPLRSSL